MLSHSTQQSNFYNLTITWTYGRVGVVRKLRTYLPMLYRLGHTNMDTTHQILKIHIKRVSDKRLDHVSHTTRLHDRCKPEIYVSLLHNVFMLLASYNPLGEPENKCKTACSRVPVENLCIHCVQK